MFELTDFRKTRVFKDAFVEGKDEGFEQGFRRGFEQGLKEGRERGIESVALKLLEMNYSIAELITATGLTPARIRKLSKMSQN